MKRTFADQQAGVEVWGVEVWGVGGWKLGSDGLGLDFSSSLFAQTFPAMGNTSLLLGQRVLGLRFRRRCLTLCPLSTASENCHDFHPMFFTHDRSFEEFFCICIQLLNKTWKEMRATSEDFNKVPEESARPHSAPFPKAALALGSVWMLIRKTSCRPAGAESAHVGNVCTCAARRWS